MAIVSAGLVGYFAKITGTVEVGEPVFYLDGDGSLLLNEEPEDGTFVINTNNQLIFFSDSLGVDDFYSANYEIFIRSESDDNPETYLLVDLWLADEDNNLIDEKICGIKIKSTTSKITRSDTCTGLELTLSKTDKFALVIQREEDNGTYNVFTKNHDETNMWSRIQITAI